MGKKKSSSFNNLEKQLTGIYESDLALKYLKQFEEDRYALLETEISTWQEPTVQEKIADMASALGMSDIQSAFKTYKDYESYATPILSSINDKQYDSALESMQLATDSYLKNNYVQTLKATEMLSSTLEKADRLGVTSHLDTYNTKLADIALEYATNKPSAVQGIVGLSSSIDTDIFKQEMKALSATEALASHAIEEVEKAKKTVIETPGFHDRMLENPIYEPPIFETPKYEDTIMGKADKQVEILEKLSVYMINQTEKIELQNEISTTQNKIIKDQVEDTAKTSKRDFRTAIASIVLSIIFGSGLTYYVFHEEDKSDKQNHIEMTALIKANNNNVILNELVLQLKQQNKNIEVMNQEFVKENQYLQNILETKK